MLHRGISPRIRILNIENARAVSRCCRIHSIKFASAKSAVLSSPGFRPCARLRGTKPNYRKTILPAETSDPAHIRSPSPRNTLFCPNQNNFARASGVHGSKVAVSIKFIALAAPKCVRVAAHKSVRGQNCGDYVAPAKNYDS
jgi:hypothetical protein